jgi:acetyltransferase-like isoleucine patch superfamily enzyme
LVPARRRNALFPLPMTTPNPTTMKLEPLLRYMGLPPGLVRRAPQSNTLSLQTFLLKDSPLAAGSNFQFADSCRVTVVEGALERLAANVKLTLAGPPRVVHDLHLAVLTPSGLLNVTVGGDNVRAFFGAGVVGRPTITLAGQATLFVGDGTTLPNARILAANADVVIGDDCQIGEDVVIQASDQHPIIDLDSGETLNHHRRTVMIDRHVWIGRRCLILPDVTLGAGCIVDAGSTVMADVAPQTLAGGSPAVLRRQRVGWARQFGSKPPAL